MTTTTTTTTADGITVTETQGVFRDADGRYPSFVGLARTTGGLYAEKIAGMSVGDALAAAGLDFTVVKGDDLTVRLPDTDTRVAGLTRMSGTVATYPDGRPPRLLGVVGSNYPVVQPREAAEFGQAVLEEGGATIAAIGAYGDPRGSRMFLALRMPDGIRIGGEDPHDLYLGLGNSWDRGTGLWAVAAPIRFACTNQFSAAFSGAAGRFSIPHRGDMVTKVAEVQRALNLTNLFSQTYSRVAEQLLAEPMTGPDVDAFLDRLLPTPTTVKTDRGEVGWATRRATVAQIIRDGENNTVGRGTRYAALQGVIEWVDWVSPARSQLNRFTRNVDGGRHEQIKNQAAEMLLAGL
jgi:phage/plasmid-like protein (TIGR03299 family)